ncbi:GNAT family N-acetyltransferase [Aquibacillus halophilus]|uniref:GNAT family N-acetyltransferase n=1 Tax=Aquibacillus halophilus TaxID=930132 RepID=A0A6A8DHE1_9BACI|nr:GNAT family N-acetyltransferase [Aquibacillus halophilus]MRH45093.1 GNAT family N-acetyltransferase [Aquibacillus halophilus]
MIELRTKRLILRPYDMEDAARTKELAGMKEIAETTISIPHPYTFGDAESWIRNSVQLIDENLAYPLAIVLQDDNLLIGTMTLRIDKQHNKGELAYWVGKDYWNKGYAQESGKRMIKFGFEELNLNRIYAPAMSKNKASTRAMGKIGMSYEGTLKQDIIKWGEYQDVDIYGLLQSDYQKL